MRRSVTILLVEDDKSMLYGMSDLLQVVDIDYDIQVLTAGNGREALEMIDRRIPDIIVSDIMMPVMDGFEFLAAVQKKIPWLNIPFIFLSARGEKHEIYKGRLSGAALYVTKPFHSVELLELIKTQLDRKFQLEYTHEQHINTLKKDILQILNHEFRTPLTYVTAYYEMLADSMNTYADANNFQEYLRGIQAGCIRLNRLIESFITIIELRTGEARQEFLRNARQIDDLNAVIEAAIEANQNKAAHNGLEIQYTPIQDMPPVFGVKAELAMVFQQLLDNAIKFSSRRLGASPGNVIKVSTAVTENELLIAFQDFGVGLPEQMQPQVFDLFVQYNREQLEQQGAGVGLTIAEGLAKLHHGRIEIQSEENVGSTFTVHLPIYTGQPWPVFEEEKTAQDATVLVVEDDQFLLEGLQELLEIYNGQYKLTILTANNGQKGLEVLARHTPDLIITDIMMPVMDGYAFLREVRKNPEWVQIPFIFLTAKGERSDIHDGLRRGVEEYITKPYDSDELLGLTIKQLNRHFQMKHAMSRSFDALKRSIIELITPDFRVPLASVAKYSGEFEQRISEARTDEDLKYSLQGIQNSSQRLSRLIEDFIALAELKTGEADMAYDLRMTSIGDVGILLYEAGQFFDQQAAQKGLQISCPIMDELPDVLGDRSSLTNCLHRLLDIGLSYYRPSLVDRHIRLTAVHDAPEQALQLSLQFPFPLPAEEEKLFQQHLAQDNLEMQGASNYLPSLSIIKGYLDLHHGRLTLLNSPTHFTFRVTLPTREATNAYA